MKKPKKKKNKKQVEKQTRTFLSSIELSFWCGVFIIGLLYFHYSKPLNRIDNAMHWWKVVLTNSQHPILPAILTHGEIRITDKDKEQGIYFDGNIARFDRNKSLQIIASGDGYPNGRTDMPFLENKVAYTPDSTQIPMYWVAPIPAEIEVNFNKIYTIDRIEITTNTDQYGAGEYSVEVWDDKTNSYTELNPPIEYIGPAGQQGIYDFTPVSTSKVKLTVTKGGTGNNFAYISDFKIFEKGS